jgi:hypothetical protein
VKANAKNVDNAGRLLTKSSISDFPDGILSVFDVCISLCQRNSGAITPETKDFFIMPIIGLIIAY